MRKTLFLLLIFAIPANGANSISTQGHPPGGRTSVHSLPMKKTNPGVETVNLLRVYRLPKWDLGAANAPKFTPPEGNELIVVRFSRQSLVAGKELPRNHVVLSDESGKTLESAPRDIWMVSSAGWTENIFVAPKGTRLDALVINDVRFHLKGVKLK